MEQRRPLAPCLIETGTLVDFRDMLRALETLEGVHYTYTVDTDIIAEGDAALVKLMADSESATLIVNGCLFLNVGSFGYLDFGRTEAGEWRFVLYGDGTTLELIAVAESDDEDAPTRPHLLSEELAPDFDALISLDDEEDDD